MRCCMRQRDKAFIMAGDELVDTGCVAGGAFAAQSAVRPRANAGMMDRRTVAIATTPRVQVLSIGTCSWST
jgi:hypothetical protein